MKAEGGHGQAKILTADEINRLFVDGFSCDRDRALFGVCLYTGCRINEACTLATSDAIDSKGVKDNLIIRKKNTKGQQETREIATATELRGYLERHQPGKQHLFSGRHGRGHINPRSAAAILEEAFKTVGIEGGSTHSFRRTALTQMANAGVPLHVIQKISGHKSLQALQRYLAVSEQQVKDAIAALKFL
ncbi:tyrosine-type recombinase/integrase [Leptolyngbyaceae cyanobacterium UHCC 1019]